jgi:hypothetical protein
LPPTALFDQDYRLARLPPRVRAPLLLRLARRRGGLVRAAAHALCDLLCVELELGARPEPTGALPVWALSALDELAAYDGLAANGWRGRDRWFALLQGLRRAHHRELNDAVHGRLVGEAAPVSLGDGGGAVVEVE